MSRSADQRWSHHSAAGFLYVERYNAEGYIIDTRSRASLTGSVPNNQLLVNNVTLRTIQTQSDRDFIRGPTLVFTSCQDHEVNEFIFKSTVQVRTSTHTPEKGMNEEVILWSVHIK